MEKHRLYTIKIKFFSSTLIRRKVNLRNETKPEDERVKRTRLIYKN